MGTSRDTDARIGYSAPAYPKDERAMSIRLSRFARVVLVAAVVLLTTCRSWAIYDELGPSKDEWGLKYDVAVNEADANKLTVEFTLADEGRLKPLYSVTVVAFSKQTDSQGGRSYDVKAPIELKTTEDGKRVGHVQIRKEFADRAKIRILTLTIDGKRRSSGAFYDIPLKKYLNTAPSAGVPLASPPASKVTK
jgi:hypothetical protein